MRSIDALPDALDEFTGGVVLVSHDSRLIPRVCHGEEKSETGVVEDGTLDTFPGTLEEYKEELQKMIKVAVESTYSYLMRLCLQSLHVDSTDTHDMNNITAFD